MAKKFVASNFVFRLHYEDTVNVFLAFALFLIILQSPPIKKPPIQCTGLKSVNQTELNAACLGTSFTLVEPARETAFESLVMRSLGETPKDTDRHPEFLLYYNGLPVLMLLQAFLFYLPRCLQFWYDFQIKRSLRLDGEIDKQCQANVDQFCRATVQTLLKKPIICSNFVYCLYVLLEIVNLWNVLFQFLVLHVLFNKNYLTYGLDVLQFHFLSSIAYDPIRRTFPTQASCMYDHDLYACTLPFNGIAGIFYLFVWFWFVLLIVLGALNLFCRLVFACSIEARCEVILAKTGWRVNETDLKSIVYNASIGEWHVLKVLVDNLPTKVFKQFVKQYHP